MAAVLATLALWLPAIIAATGAPSGAEPGVLPAQAGYRASDLAQGKFLVAKRDLRDSNFSQTVILLLRYDEKGALGLIVNRPSGVRVSRIFEKLGSETMRSSPLYIGGPVGRQGAMALYRSPVRVEGATHVFDGVYSVSTRELLEKALSAASGPEELRIFMGYSGWGAGQLDREMEMDSWVVFPGEVDAVFHPEPESVWTRLIRRTELRIAGLPPPGPFRFGPGD